MEDFIASLPLVKARDARLARPITPAEWRKMVAELKAPPRQPTKKEWAAHLRKLKKEPEWKRKQDAELAEWKARWDAEERLRSNASTAREAKGKAFMALRELLEMAMHPGRLEDYATARIGEIIAEGLDCLAEIGTSTSPAAPRARGALDEIKRRLKRAGDFEAKRRQRERLRGGKSPRPRSKLMTGLVAELVAKVQAAHKQGERRLIGVPLPEWSFGGAYGNDTRGLAVRNEWTCAMMRLVDEVVAKQLDERGAFDGNKWCDRQRDQARREIMKLWRTEENRRRESHREWVAQGMMD